MVLIDLHFIVLGWIRMILDLNFSPKADSILHFLHMIKKRKERKKEREREG